MVGRGGGVQRVRAARGLTAIAASRPDALASGAAVNPVHLGNGSLAGTTPVGGTSVSLTTTQPVADTAVTVAARVGDTADLQLWLGMVGHMIGAGAPPPPHPKTAPA